MSATLTKLLDVAEQFCQTRGYNGFSYRDLAEVVGIKSASIHYHFPTKADLGRALVVRYRQAFETTRVEIDRSEAQAIARIRRLFAGLADGYRSADRICLAGMMAAESGTLPENVQAEVRRFFEENEAWLADTLKLGVSQGNVRPVANAEAEAKTIFGTIEGAILAARAFSDASRIRLAGDWVIRSLQA
ncbi:MAG TPA: TetR/AcrR family transcriptional regulator [Tepidisphaeraceae bacterium]|nr:TetR/AcrR family transcriptional regulator [Tepidisphaeraceae bacterium]